MSDKTELLMYRPCDYMSIMQYSGRFCNVTYLIILSFFYHNRHNYCLRTKFEKIMFSQVSVCLQGGYLPHCRLGYTSRQTPPSPGTRGRHSQADTPSPGRHHPCEVHTGIWSTSGWYTSHWNAFLLLYNVAYCNISLSIYCIWSVNQVYTKSHIMSIQHSSNSITEQLGW